MLNRKRFDVLLIAAVLLLGAGSANAIMTGFGNSGSLTPTQTYVRPDGTDVEFNQGTMPGAILTPMIRLDIQASGLASAASGDVEIIPSDVYSELMSIRLRFKDCRLKDIAAIAIAREGGDGFSSETGAPFASVPEGQDPATLERRVGDGNEERPSRVAAYTPDEDPLLAYVSYAEILSSTGANPYDRGFTVTLNLSNIDDTVPSVAYNDFGPFYVNSDELESEPDPTAAYVESDENNTTNYGTFYILVAPSNSIQNGDKITVEVDVEQGTTPSAQVVGQPALIDLNNYSGPDNLPDQISESFVRYDFGGGGMVLRFPQVAWEVAADISPPEGFLAVRPAETYTSNNTINNITFPGNLSGTIECVDMISDQTPLRVVHNVDEGVHPGDQGGIEQSPYGGIGSRVWGQFPPAWPLLTTIPSNEYTLNQVRPLGEFPDTIPGFDWLPSYLGRWDVQNQNIAGRFHPDSGIPSDTLKSPEVLAAGNQVYSIFGIDMAGGWAGGYDWRLGGLWVEVQGLGKLGEIPRDGIDNDMDGLTDEWGVEDNPQDHQLPGRNDDFDFFTELRTDSLFSNAARFASGQGIDGSFLTASERELLQTISELYTKRQAMPEPFSDPCSWDFGLRVGTYDVGWDPVFDVVHVLDDAYGNISETTPNFLLPEKYYRDLVVPGFKSPLPDSVTDECSWNPSGLTARIQPELAIRFDLLEDPESDHYNPARAAYFRSLMKIGALQSRWVNEDGDGLTDEEVANGIDDDGDGLIDEDVNFVPAYMAIDEEIANYFVDRQFVGARTAAFDDGIDYVYIDYNHNGVYDTGRQDGIAPNRDEFQGVGSHPLRQGDSYAYPNAYPIDDDLDVPGEDGNPLTPPPVYAADMVADDANPLTILNANEDVRDLVMDYYNLYNNPSECIDFLPGWNSWVWEDTNNNSRLDPGIFFYRQPNGPGDNTVDTPVQFWDSTRHHDVRGPSRVRWRDDDRYLMFYDFADREDGLGPIIPTHADGKFDFFLGFQLPPNLPVGLDFQVSVYGANSYLTFDSREDFNPLFLNYAITSDTTLLERFPVLEDLGRTAVLEPAVSTAYQVTKRQHCHLEINDMMGYRSPVEVDGGFRGRPYLEANSEPTAILGLNLVDAVNVSTNMVMYGNINEWLVNVYDRSMFGYQMPNAPLESLQSQIDMKSLVIDSIRINFDPVDITGRDDEFASTSGLFNPTGADGDLLPLRDDEMSGVSLYMDVNNIDNLQLWDPLSGDPLIDDPTFTTFIEELYRYYETGVFDQFDRHIPLRTNTLAWDSDPEDPVVKAGGHYVILTPKHGIPIPDSDFYEIPNYPFLRDEITRGQLIGYPEISPLNVVPEQDRMPSDPNRGYDLFVVLRTSQNVSARKSFRAYIRPGDIKFSNGSNVLGSEFTSSVYTINVPNEVDMVVNESVEYARDAFKDVVEERREDLVWPENEDDPYDDRYKIFINEAGVFDNDKVIGLQPKSDSVVIANINMHSASSIARLSTISMAFESYAGVDPPFIDDLPEQVRPRYESGEETYPFFPEGKAHFTPSDLMPLTNDILFNIPLDPSEDDDNNPETFPIPDGVDNDGDGLTDEGLNNTLSFDQTRYTSLSGVALFRDMPDSDNIGVFDDPLDPNVLVPDLPVYLSGEEDFSFPASETSYLSLALDHDPTQPTPLGKGDPVDPEPFERIPENDLGLNSGPDLFLVVRSSKTMTMYDRFRVHLGVHWARFVPGAFEQVVGNSFSFMPGTNTGIAPVFPYREPYGQNTLVNSTLVPSATPIVQEPISPGNLLIPGMPDGYPSTFLISPSFDLNESYKSGVSFPVYCLKNNNDIPVVDFISPAPAQVVVTDRNSPNAPVNHGIIPVRWVDVDQDGEQTGKSEQNDLTRVTLVYYDTEREEPITPFFDENGSLVGNLKPVIGVRRQLNPNEYLPEDQSVAYIRAIMAEDNDGQNDLFSWDTRNLPPGRTYRIGAIVEDFVNAPRVYWGGHVTVTNHEPDLCVLEP